MSKMLKTLESALIAGHKQKNNLLQCLVRIRTFLIDFMVTLQEQALYESNKPSSHGSSLSDELGSLIELLMTQLHHSDLHKCLMNMGHMIRVWLQLPK